MLPLVAAARLIHVRPRSAPQFRTGRGKGTGREGEAEAMLSVISNSFRERRPSSRRLLARSARTGINIRPRLSEETSSSPPSFPFSLSLVVFYILVRSREDAATRGENALFCAEPRSLHRGDHSSWVGGDFFFFRPASSQKKQKRQPVNPCFSHFCSTDSVQRKSHTSEYDQPRNNEDRSSLSTSRKPGHSPVLLLNKIPIFRY